MQSLAGIPFYSRPTARLRCVCLLRFTMLYFIACCSFSMIFSLRATMLINLNLNLNLTFSTVASTDTYTGRFLDIQRHL